MSQKIIRSVSNRYDKDYMPRQEMGDLTRYSDVTQVDMSHGEWLVLTTANHFLDDIKEFWWEFSSEKFKGCDEKIDINLPESDIPEPT